MIDVLKQQFTKDMPYEERLNRAREFLQILCLKILYDKGLLDDLAFVGGTALRILFDIRRFSEDLDFSLIKKGKYSFPFINSELCRGFELYGLKMESKPKKGETNVHGAFLRFGGLLKELGISPLASQVLSIKIEVDANPPAGGNVLTTFVNKIYPITVTHYDLPSMFATKLHACFYRKFTKGRDFYDLIWYMSKKVKPNFPLLNNAIEQTQGASPGLDERNLKGFILERIERLDFDSIKKDVERFLEDKAELNLLEPEPIKGTLGAFY